MLKKLFASVRQAKDWEERLSELEQSVEDLEGRMDVDEARRHEWIGTVKRTLARINKADQRETESLSDGHNGGRTRPLSVAEAHQILGR